MGDNLNEKLACFAGCFLSQFATKRLYIYYEVFLFYFCIARYTFFLSISNCFSGVMVLGVWPAVKVPAEWHLHLLPASRGNANNHAARGTKISILLLKSLLIKSQLAEDNANLSCSFSRANTEIKALNLNPLFCPPIELSIVLKL